MRVEHNIPILLSSSHMISLKFYSYGMIYILLFTVFLFWSFDDLLGSWKKAEHEKLSNLMMR